MAGQLLAHPHQTLLPSSASSIAVSTGSRWCSAREALGHGAMAPASDVAIGAGSEDTLSCPHSLDYRWSRHSKICGEFEPPQVPELNHIVGGKAEHERYGWAEREVVVDVGEHGYTALVESL